MPVAEVPAVPVGVLLIDGTKLPTPEVATTPVGVTFVTGGVYSQQPASQADPCGRLVPAISSEAVTSVESVVPASIALEPALILKSVVAEVNWLAAVFENKFPVLVVTPVPVNDAFE